ncbi:MAG TPA: cob(I)yrinic acid a,c-diamide adenosyltransferase [candidate division Zixibacteria bacterium]|jgi:cob(I)alamin adenosyltransferase|nr:cob(I)yrinic acid a,c-diamide adenosyltransferase [candidate division Zixibacteria bacterium]
MKGMIHVYTGDGKGKTTAALGLGMRAAGHGKKVLMVQFMKGRTNYGELESAKRVPGFCIVQFGRPDFVDRKNPDPRDIEGAGEALSYALEAAKLRSCDLLILDELNVALDFGLVSLGEVKDFLAEKPEEMEIVITGRNAHPDIIELADLVTEMREVRHYYRKGVQARQGIEH